MFLHVLTHVYAPHRVLVIKQKLCQRARQLRLAHSRGPEKNETAHRPLGILQPTARAPHRVGHRRHGFVLADHSFVQTLLHAHEFLALAFHHAIHGNARPRRHHTGNVLLGHLLVQQPITVLPLDGFFGRHQFTFQIRNAPVLNLRRRRQIARALSCFLVAPRLINLAVDDAGRVDRRFLILPLPLDLCGALFQIRQLPLQLFQALP